LLRSNGPETFVNESMFVYDLIEVLTPDLRSNQVVVRYSYRYEWINNPPWYWFPIEKVIHYELGGMSKIPAWQIQKV